jgi:polysaccharide biosynthesis/export protein
MKPSMKRVMFSTLTIVAGLVVTAGLPMARAGQKPEVSKSQHEPATTDSTYVIGPEDVLNIDVWKEQEISRSVPVRPDGKISLPLLNDVQAAGLTPMQLQASIMEGLKKFISDPQVTVIVTQINSQKIFVLGEVARPGTLPMLPHMTVLQAISTAGGVGQFAKESRIYVLRNENGHQKTFPFNYKDVVRGKRPEQNIELKPGDTIVVP